MVLVGEKKNLDQATAFLEQREFGSAQISQEEQFCVVAYMIPENSPWSGKSIADINFRRNYGVTIIGIERDGQRIINPTPVE